MNVLVRGGGDLASGVAYRLHQVGIRLTIAELPQPLAVRRLVSFSEAVYDGQIIIEGVTARKCADISEIKTIQKRGEIPVIVDSHAEIRFALNPAVLIDARMTKSEPDLNIDCAPFVIGLGPGFHAGVNCHAVIETNRGHLMGRIIWKGTPQEDTGVPGEIGNHSAQRVVRAPVDGVLKTSSKICDGVKKGETIAAILTKKQEAESRRKITAPFDGVVRGLLREGTSVHAGMKIGDIDPRNDPECCTLISDKSRAIGGAVLVAILSRQDLRTQLWQSG